MSSKPRILRFDRLESRQLLSAYVWVQYGGRGGIFYDAPGESSISKSGNPSASFPLFSYAGQWTGQASVSNTTLGNPIGTKLEADTFNTVTINFPSGTTYQEYVGAPTLSHAEWSDSFVVAASPVLEQNPFVRLAFQVSVDLGATPEPDNENPADSATDYYAGIALSPNKWGIGPGGVSYGLTGLGVSSIPTTFAFDVPVQKEVDGNWSGSWKISVEAGTPRVYASRLALTATSQATVAATVVDARLADGTEPDFSPEKPNLKVGKVDWDFSNGGVKLNYEIEGGPLPFFTDIQFFWTNSNVIQTATLKDQAAPPITTGVAIGSYTPRIPATAFSAPPEGTTHLIVALDYSKQINEKYEDDNGNLNGEALVIVPPTIEILVNPSSPEKGHPYTVKAKVTNNGPVPFNFSLDWRQLYMSPAGLTGAASGEAIVGGNGKIVGWQEQDLGVGPIGFQKSTEVALGNGTFITTWDWIDRKNPIDAFWLGDKTSRTVIKEGLKKIIPWISEVDLIRKALKEIVGLLEADKSAEFQFSVHLTDAVAVPVGRIVDVDFEQAVTLNVPDTLQNHFHNYVLSSVAGGELWSAAIKLALAGLLDPTKASWFAATGFAAAGSLLVMKARTEYDQAVDPPDYNYTQIATPQLLSIPAIEDLPVGPYKELAQTAQELQAVHRAASISRDRAIGAGLSGDDYWESSQFSAAADYTATVSQLEARLAALFTRLQPAITEDLAPYAGQVTPFLEANGLPDRLAQLLPQLGWSTDQIENLRQNITLMASAGEDDPSLISGILKVSSLVSASIAADDLQRSVQIRVDALDHEVRELDAVERDLLDGMRVGIEAGLTHGVPNGSLQTAITNFLGEVHRLTLLTNNPTALKGDLDFGHQAHAAYLKLIVASDPVVEDPGPKVTAVVRFGYHAQPTTFVVSFDSDLNSASAQNLSNYQLVGIGRDGRFGTRDDRRIRLRSINYDAATRSATLNPANRLALRSRYRLVLKGSAGGLSDTAGQLLDGDSDGKAGGDHVRVIDQRDLAGPAPSFRKLAASRMLRRNRN
jgi:hypothetical protein